MISETDRTIIGLLFHENIIDYINGKECREKINIYKQILENYCFGDYMDRIIFQKQIMDWATLSGIKG